MADNTNQEFLDYIQERDAQLDKDRQKRQNRWVVGVFLAVVLVVAGFVINENLKAQRETQRFEDRRVEQFREALEG